MNHILTSTDKYSRLSIDKNFLIENIDFFSEVSVSVYIWNGWKIYVIKKFNIVQQAEKVQLLPIEKCSLYLYGLGSDRSTAGWIKTQLIVLAWVEID